MRRDSPESLLALSASWSLAPRTAHTPLDSTNRGNILLTAAILGLDGHRMLPIKVTVISGRSLSQARSREQGKFSEDYIRSVAVCELDPDDMHELGAKDGENVKVATVFGEVVVRATISKQAPHKGIIFIPYGAWASMLFGTSTETSGMPTLKGVEATVIRAPEEKIATLQEITRMKAK